MGGGFDFAVNFFESSVRGDREGLTVDADELPSHKFFRAVTAVESGDFALGVAQ